MKSTQSTQLKQPKKTGPRVLVSFWSSHGELELQIDGKFYIYRADLACIKRAIGMIRDDRRPGLALNYIKTVCTSWAGPYLAQGVGKLT